MVIDLGETEKEHGLAYIALSCATKLSNIGIVGLPCTQLTSQISRHWKVSKRKEEDKWLAKLASTTYDNLQSLEV